MNRIAALFVLAISSAANATPKDSTVISYGLDPELIPMTCRDMVTGTRMGARMSVASCAAQLSLSTVTLDDSKTAIHQIEHAVRFSMELLDSVAAVGSPVERVEALRAQCDQYAGMIARMRRAAPFLLWHTTGDLLANAQDRHDAIEEAVLPWVRAAAKADAEIARIVAAHPDVRRDPVARYAVR